MTETQDGLGQFYGPLAAKGPYRAEWAAVAPRAEEAVLEGHGAEIHSVCALDPGSHTLLASASDDGTDSRGLHERRVSCVAALIAASAARHLPTGSYRPS